jgi:L-lactate dehydrogenase complex protein LldG
VGRGEARRLVESLCRSHGGGRCLVDLELSFELRSGPWDPLDPELAPPAVADTNVFAARGLVGAAENGAIAVPLGAGAPRAALFLCQHLILVLDADAVEPDLHRALSRLASLLPSGASHAWIAGPSKTADIEQTLVLGAHGPRTLDLVGVRGD